MIPMWAVLAAASLGAAGAWIGARIALRVSPRPLLRVNVEGKEVPAVLGWGLLDGVLLSAGAMTAYIAYRNADGVWSQCVPAPGEICTLDLVLVSTLLGWLPLIPVSGMFLAGTWDDLRGDERPRGFAGHLGALRGGAVTGGIVKLVAGAAVALMTISALAGWEIPPILDWLIAAAPIALAANLWNLLDRAPGRALKAFLLCAAPLLLVGEWRVMAAGMVGAAVALLPLDLKAKGMLGDAGANPLGAMIGLGMVLAITRLAEDSVFPRGWLALIVVVLLVLNLASERWSFSAVIERTPWLARLDHLGRK